MMVLSTLALALLLVTPPAPPAKVLHLEEAIRTALERQPQLLQARAGTEGALARADAARAPLLPQVSASAGFQRATGNATSRPGTDPGTPGSSPTFDTFNFFSLNGTVSQLIYDFGQTYGRWRAAQAGADAQRASERSVHLQVLQGVQVAFLGARAQKDLVAVARETLANQERHLQQIEGFVEVGARARIDLTQVRTERANARVQLINAENSYEIAKAQLNQAMGVEGDTDYDVADETLPPFEGEDLPVERQVEEALGTRPDLAALEAQVRAQSLVLGAIRGAYWPSLGASTGISDVGTGLDRLVWNWNAQLTLNWQLFQGGLTTAQEREARASLSSVEAQQSQVRQQVWLEVSQARLALRGAKGALEASREALVSA